MNDADHRHSHDDGCCEAKRTLLHRNGPGAHGKPWNVTVDVYLNNDDDPPDFDIRTCLETIPGDIKHPILVFNNYERNGFSIEFQLWDNTGNNYKFPKDPRLAVWSQKGECPKGPDGVWDIFKPQGVSPDGLTLTVSNANSSSCPLGYFYYTLRATNGDNWVELDPGGVNNNGATNLA